MTITLGWPTRRGDGFRRRKRERGPRPIASPPRPIASSRTCSPAKRRRKGSAQSVAQLAALVGIVAGFWHITWVAGVAFLVAGLVAVGVHSAGYWRVETTRDTES
jgi:hypothetical protein